MQTMGVGAGWGIKGNWRRGGGKGAQLRGTATGGLTLTLLLAFIDPVARRRKARPVVHPGSRQPPRGLRGSHWAKRGCR